MPGHLESGTRSTLKIATHVEITAMLLTASAILPPPPPPCQGNEKIPKEENKIPTETSPTYRYSNKRFFSQEGGGVTLLSLSLSLTNTEFADP